MYTAQQKTAMEGSNAMNMDEVFDQSCLPPLTPPASEDGTGPTEVDLSVLTALHVMTTERIAMQNLETLYRTNKTCQKNLAKTVATISDTSRRGGKLVICGIGKSGRIGHKIVATMNSLGITSIFLHPTEALHGDLGMIKEVRSRYKRGVRRLLMNP